MREIESELWTTPADLRCITTNGHVTREGKAVMGRGCALEAKGALADIDFMLGHLLQVHGNRVLRLTRVNGAELASFPVKHHWREKADPELIRRSADQLREMADKFGYKNVVLPRPGCGNGGLVWDDVKLILAPRLDGRFTVVHK